MHAETVRCLSCGAGVMCDSPQCPFCRVLLKAAACPRCRGMMFRGAKFCSNCGCEAKVVDVGMETAQSCPRCDKYLIEVVAGKLAMEQCPSCAGLWLPVESFDALLEDAESHSAATGLMLARGSPGPELIKYPKCPFCQEPMGRVNYARSSGVLINVCRAHGVWLDTDELNQIMDFIRSGGLDRARAKERQTLERERQRLAHERSILNDERVRQRFGREILGPTLGPLWWL